MSATTEATKLRKQIKADQDKLRSLTVGVRRERVAAFKVWTKKRFGNILRKGTTITRTYDNTYWMVTGGPYANEFSPYPTITVSEVGPRGGNKKTKFFFGPAYVRQQRLTKTDLRYYKSR